MPPSLSTTAQTSQAIFKYICPFSWISVTSYLEWSGPGPQKPALSAAVLSKYLKNIAALYKILKTCRLLLLSFVKLRREDGRLNNLRYPGDEAQLIVK